jgi:hemoglobin
LALAVSLALLWTSTGAVADDKPATKLTPEQKALDATIRKSLFDVTDYGARLYNSGDVQGGYHVFQGGLIGARPLLSHHPELQTYILEGLKAADKMEDIEKASFKLRAVLDNVREALKSGELPADSKPLWARLGGEKGVTKVVDDFMTLAAADPKVNFTRDGKYKIDKDKLRTALVAQISSLTGGPLKYDKDMKAVHKDMNITDAEFTAAVNDLKTALKQNGVASDDARDVLEAVEDMRKDIVAPKVAAPKTVWDALGGDKGVTQLVDDFVASASKDPLVNFDRKGKYKLDADTLGKIKKELVRQVSYLTNGPYKPDKDAPPAWKGLGITDDEWDAAALHLVKALKDNKVPQVISERLQLAITDLRPKVVEGKPVEPPKETLWDRLGGDKGVAKIVDDFITGASKNAKANLDRGGTLKLDHPAVADKLKKSITAHLSAMVDGPVKITDEIKTFDKGLKLTDAEFDARKEELKKALEKNKIKADDVKAVLESLEINRKDLVEKKSDDKAKDSEVQGTVTVDGKPLESGKIAFNFDPPKKEDKTEPITGDIKDGKYKVSGLKPGSYRITIKAGDAIGVIYGLPQTTPLKCEITKAQEIQDFQLKGK